MLELTGVKAGYTSQEVLHGLSFSVPPGQIVAVVGTMTPSAGDVSVFQPTEQAYLAGPRWSESVPETGVSREVPKRARRRKTTARKPRR